MYKNIMMASAIAAILAVSVLAVNNHAFAVQMQKQQQPGTKNIAIGGPGGEGGAGGAGGSGGPGGSVHCQYDCGGANGGNANGGNGGNANGGNGVIINK
jgi:hypothetical protein